MTGVALDGVIRDRVAGTMLGLACGDALGAGYEFGPAIGYPQEVSMRGGGPFGWAPGEWTDDTAMAVCIAQAAADHGGLDTEAALDAVVERWCDWAAHSRDVGAQTRAVLNAASDRPTAARASQVAAELHARTGKTAGNGSLMRTAPVALAFLDDESALWEAAQRVSALTHFDPEAGEACALWCLAIRHAIFTGTYEGLEAALDRLAPARRDVWAQRLAESATSQPWQFPNNGWVVHALQAAWSAVITTPDQAFVPELHLFPAHTAAVAIERAVRAGNDTDTVAAIAGSLVGARWGMSALPLRWTTAVHGFHEVRNGATAIMRANALQHLSYQVAEHKSGPLPASFQPLGSAASALATISGVDGLLLGGHADMAEADLQDVGVISLSRLSLIHI